VKSIVDDFSMRRGIVSSRVALLLRSIEIKPLLFRLTNHVGSLLPSGEHMTRHLTRRVDSVAVEVLSKRYEVRA
jgi:hypothetical protein